MDHNTGIFPFREGLGHSIFIFLAGGTPPGAAPICCVYVNIFTSRLINTPTWSMNTRILLINQYSCQINQYSWSINTPIRSINTHDQSILLSDQSILLSDQGGKKKNILCLKTNFVFPSVFTMLQKILEPVLSCSRSCISATWQVSVGVFNMTIIIQNILSRL